jgi:branched-chain amino acid transport system permease protein
MNLSRLRPFLWLTALVILVQLLATGFKAEYYLVQLTMSVYYAIVVMGLCLLMGHTGQASLGHGGFFAIGGYVSAVLTTHNLSAYKDTMWLPGLQQLGAVVAKTNLYDKTELLVVTPWAAFLVAMLLTWIVALVVGYPSLRLKGHYLAMATLGFGLIIYRLLLGNPLTGAADGINGVPPWGLGWGLQISGKTAVRVQNYYLAWGLALIVAGLVLNVVNSRIGRAWRAIHDNETAANAMGVNTARLKLSAFVVSALLAAMAGSFLTHFNAGIGPSESSALKSVRYVALVAAGGMDNLWGSLVISVILNFLSLRGYFGTLDNAVFGAILILIVSLAPQGPLKPLGHWLRRTGRRLKGLEGRTQGVT